MTVIGKVVISGASGLLGRSVYNVFKAKGWEVIGLAQSRVSNDLVKIDLTSETEIKDFFNQHKPDLFIHCAAVRHPDFAENQKDVTYTMNVKVPEWLALECKNHNSDLIYISTNYIFDGTEAPYDTDSKVNPLNYYGLSKLQGEQTIHKILPQAVSIRIPVLYGEVEYPGESAVNGLISIVKNSAKPLAINHHSTRTPTHVDEVSRSLEKIGEFLIKKTPNFPNILHISNSNVFTEYEICQLIANTLGVSIDHLEPELEWPKDAKIEEPEDCIMKVDRTLALGINECNVGLKPWLIEHLKNNPDKY
jgi:S-adenosylmethionine synthetase